MNKEYRQALQTLELKITKNIVEDFCELLQQTNKMPQNSNDHMYWYNKSYIEFLRRFAETKSNNDKESVWIERTAYVYSWIAKIPVARLDKQAIKNMAELENCFSSSKLWEIGNASYLGGLNDPIRAIHHGEKIFGDHMPPVVIKDFLKDANSILNYGNSNLNLPTSTKLLHFLFPDLFPIFDSKVCKTLYGNGTSTNYIKYHAYVFALQDFLKKPEAQELFKLVEKTELPILRVIDIVLFQDDITIRR